MTAILELEEQVTGTKHHFREFVFINRIDSLSPASKKVLNTILNFQVMEKPCYFSMGTLAYITGYSESGISSVVTKLKKAGLIQRVTHHGKLTNTHKYRSLEVNAEALIQLHNNTTN